MFDQSLAALAPLGRLAVFGMAARTPPSPIDAGALMARSQAVIGFWLVHIVQRPELLAAAVTDLMASIADGSLRPVIGGDLPARAGRRRAPRAARPQLDRQARPRSAGLTAAQTSRPAQSIDAPAAASVNSRPVTRNRQLMSWCVVV